MQTKNALPLRLSLSLAIVLFGLIGSIASAQQPPEPDGDPVDATKYESHEVDENGNANSSTQPKKAGLVVQAGYRSDTLGGEFLAQWMFITLNGQSHPFWGARAISLDRKSPLRKLGLQAGDVVTRLDNVHIWNGMHKRKNVWQIPELEEHYGATDVRYIKHGTRRVLEGQIDLDNPDPGNNSGAPLAP